jgi:hypothetical protein
MRRPTCAHAYFVIGDDLSGFSVKWNTAAPSQFASVIPVKAGIQYATALPGLLDLRFRGDDTLGVPKTNGASHDT